MKAFAHSCARPAGVEGLWRVMEKAEAGRTSRAREAWFAAENHEQPGLAHPAGPQRSQR